MTVRTNLCFQLPFSIFSLSSFEGFFLFFLLDEQFGKIFEADWKRAQGIPTNKFEEGVMR